jgi:ATP-binding cassette subfamily B protein
MVILEYYAYVKTGSEIRTGHLVGACVGTVLSSVLYYFTTHAGYNSAYGAAMDTMVEGQLALAQHLINLPMGFFCSRDPGDLSSLLIRDFENVMNMTSVMLPRFMAGVIFPFVAVVFLYGVDWRLSLCVTLVVIASFPVVFVTRYAVHWIGKQHHQAVNEASSRMLEYIEGIKPIRAFNIGGEKAQSYREAAERLRSISIKNEIIPGPSVCLGAVILHGVLPAVMLTSVYLWDGPGLEPEDFIIFIAVCLRICDPLVLALEFTADLVYMTVSARRIQSVFQIDPLVQLESEKADIHCAITFENVDFSYNTEQVLFGVSFEARPGTMTALVGPSGSGKSTIIRLIARFWDVDGGRITIGGVPVTHFQPEDLISRISVVFQDVYLFHDTIAQNIGLARPEAEREEIEAASKAARCHDFIMQLPNGYDTVIGEGGNTLSGGQKQRISIARAILKDSPVILMDEATSSLDPQNEILIQEAVSELIQHKTVIVIAHKLQSVIGADQIIVLNRGCIVERGKHAELIQQQGLYATMWRNQQQARGWRFKE